MDLFDLAARMKRGDYEEAPLAGETLGMIFANTDVWASMGQEQAVAFQGYIVDPPLMRLADPQAIFLYCLPAHRGEEVADEVIQGPQSRVGPAGERLHAQKALMARLVGEGGER